MKLKIFSMLILVISTQGYSQKSISPLKIGDQVPEIMIPNVSNFSNKKIRLSDFKGKLVILDFWATYCKGCIAAFPKMDSLQRQFGDQIQIILVNSQSKSEIDKIFSEQRKLQPLYRNVLLNLPSVTGDTILNSLFPHYLIPHEVWIDANGKIAAITDEKSVTANNIRSYLEIDDFKLPEKKDILNHDPYKPLLSQIFDRDADNLPFYSCLIKGAVGLKPGPLYQLDTLKRSIRITRSAAPILTLYADALSHSKGYNDPFKDPYFDFGKRVILEIKDSTKYFYDSTTTFDAWQSENCYAYETILPIDKKSNIYELMLEDLNKFFNINCRMEKKKMKCLSIIRTSKTDKIKYKGPENYDGARRYIDTNNYFHLIATGFPVFRESLSIYNSRHPFIFVDNTDYKGKVNLTISSPLDDITRLRSELREKYDLDIVEVEQEIDVMILTESEFKKVSLVKK